MNTKRDITNQIETRKKIAIQQKIASRDPKKQFYWAGRLEAFDEAIKLIETLSN